jgi:hypothetical protein
MKILEYDECFYEFIKDDDSIKFAVGDWEKDDYEFGEEDYEEGEEGEEAEEMDEEELFEQLKEMKVPTNIPAE